MKKRKPARTKPQVGGEEVRVHISPIMFIMAVVFVALGRTYEFACSLTAVILHECAHARIAKKYGYALDTIRLMPYGAALCGDVDMRPKHEAAIAAAGPIFNLVTALIFAAMWWLIPTSYLFTQVFCMCNIYIGVFNLLPVYPLDGGRIALALLTPKLGRVRAYRIIRILSFVFGIASIALFILSAFYSLNVCFLAVGLFMTVSALIPDARAAYKPLFALAERKSKLNRPRDTRVFSVNGSAPLSELCAALDAEKVTVFRLYGDDMRYLGELDENALFEAAARVGYEAKAESLIRN